MTEHPQYDYEFKQAENSRKFTYAERLMITRVICVLGILWVISSMIGGF
jgi:hypothetical protein